MNSTPDQGTPLALAIYDLRRSQRDYKLRTVIVSACWIAAVATLLGTLRTGIDAPLLALSLLMLAAGALTLPRNWGDALDRVIGLQDVRAIGLLLELLPAASNRHREALQSAVLELLPLMTADNMDRLSTSERSALISSMLVPEGNQYTQLLIAFLRTLEKYGGEWALDAVREVAGTRRNTETNKAAQACLVALTARAHRSSLGATLLRAGYATQEAREMLRAVSVHDAPTDADQTHLLRASEVDKGNPV